MKRFLISALSLICATAAFGQEDALDSLFYVKPAFTHGFVYLNDGSVQQGNINICNIDQTIRFITPDGDTLVMDATEEAKRVNIDKTTYYRFNDRFTEMVDYAGDIALGVQRQSVQIDNSKAGGYGTSATAAVESYGVDAFTGRGFKHFEMVPENWRYTCRYVLHANGKFYMANRKNFIKLFPDKKDVIEAFCAADRSILNEPDKVKELFLILK